MHIYNYLFLHERYLHLQQPLLVAEYWTDCLGQCSLKKLEGTWMLVHRQHFGQEHFVVEEGQIVQCAVMKLLGLVLLVEEEH